MTIERQTRRVAGVMLAAVVIAGCDFISPIESNPNTVDEASVDQLFTSVQIVSYFLGTGGLSRIASIWTQQMAGIQRQHGAFDNYVITDADFEDEFNALYTQGGLIDLREAIAQAEAAGRNPYAGILKIHEAYLVGLIASFYGDIPYREAVTDSIATPVLDDQAQVYADLQALLDEAIINLGGTGTGPAGTLDMSFAGNVNRWLAVAYTLKARYHMHWAELNGSASYTAARAAALSGIQSAAGTWKTNFGVPQTETNIWNQFLSDRLGDVGSGETLVPLLIGNSDPRLPIYFDDFFDANTPQYSTLSPAGYGAGDYDLPLVTCAENYFILAESEFQVGTVAAARTAANNALDCEEAEHGVDLSAEQTIINGLAGAALLDKIMEQKYIALFLNPEVFNDYKRTCLPAITERPGGMPGRLFYASQERATNPFVPNTGVDPNDTYNDNDPAPC